MHPTTSDERAAVLDHGTFSYGLLPGYSEPVTAVVTHRNFIVPSYNDSHADYRKTIFDGAFERLFGKQREGAREQEPVVPATQYAVDGEEYAFPEGELQYIGHGFHAGFKWQEHSFCRKLKAGEIEIPAPVVIKSYTDDVLVHEDYVGELRQTFIEYVQTLREEGRARPTPTESRKEARQ